MLAAAALHAQDANETCCLFSCFLQIIMDILETVCSLDVHQAV